MSVALILACNFVTLSIHSAVPASGSSAGNGGAVSGRVGLVGLALSIGGVSTLGVSTLGVSTLGVSTLGVSTRAGVSTLSSSGIWMMEVSRRSRS